MSRSQRNSKRSSATAELAVFVKALTISADCCDETPDRSLLASLRTIGDGMTRSEDTELRELALDLDRVVTSIDRLHSSRFSASTSGRRRTAKRLKQSSLSPCTSASCGAWRPMTLERSSKNGCSRSQASALQLLPAWRFWPGLSCRALQSKPFGTTKRPNSRWRKWRPAARPT